MNVGAGGTNWLSPVGGKLRMKAGRQTTLQRRVSVTGTGVHSGTPVTVNFQPAPSGTGIVFIRSGGPGQPDREVKANAHAVIATDLATVLGDASGPVASTIEHVMAALCGLGIDNAFVELDAVEVPIMDGSAVAFVEALDRAGVAKLAAPRRYTKVLKPIRVSKGDAFGELRPYDRGFRIEAEIDFAHPLVGRQAITIDVEPDTFRRELARARTFGFMCDVERLWSAGFALGANLENSVALTKDRILNPEGLRFADEFVRHKALDAIGDLALAGAPILGAYRTVRGGHRLNHAVLSALIADRSAWTVVEAEETAPRRMRGHAELGIAGIAAAYRADAS